MSDTPAPTPPAQPDPAQPTPPAQPAPAPTPPAVNPATGQPFTPAQITVLQAEADRLAANLQHANAGRPESQADRLAYLQGILGAAATVRTPARDVARDVGDELDQLRADMRQRDIRDVARELNFHDPADALALVPRDAADVRAALVEAVKVKPYLVRSPAPSAPIGGRNGGSGAAPATGVPGAPPQGATVAADGRVIDPGVQAIARQIAAENATG
jgi:hypothetical protein